MDGLASRVLDSVWERVLEAVEDDDLDAAKGWQTLAHHILTSPERR